MEEFCVLFVLIFFGVYLVGTTHLHVPYWHVPLAGSLVIASLGFSLIDQLRTHSLGWKLTCLAWVLGVGLAALVIIAKNRGPFR